MGVEGAWLAHHGIKGMKWGVRRFRNEDGSLTDLGKKRYGIAKRIKFPWSSKKKTKPKASAIQDENSKDFSPKKRRISTMTDEELRKDIARLELEKKYKNLYQEMHPKKKHAVLKFIASKSGTFLSKATDKMIENAINNMFGSDKGGNNNQNNNRNRNQNNNRNNNQNNDQDAEHDN